MARRRRAPVLPRAAVRTAIVSAASVSFGCASLDPTENLDEASALVSEHTGFDTVWDAPWNEPSAEWDGTSPLSADAAVRVALINNRELRRDVESIVAQRADFVQAHLLPNPVINLSYGFVTDGLGGAPMVAGVMQQLAWLWQRPAAIAEAESALRARVLSVSDAAVTLVADVRTQHATVFFASQAAEVQRANIDLMEQSVALLREHFTVGEASRLDLDRAEIDLEVARAHLVDRVADLDRARRALLERLGRADARADWVAVGTPLAEVGDALTLEEADVIALACEQRLDVAAAAARLDAEAARIDRAEADALPDVAIGVGYQRNFADREAVAPGLSITPRLFDDHSARKARADSEWRQAQIESDRIRQAAVAEARAAWVELRAQLDVVEAYETDILERAARGHDLARLAFEAGETDLTVLLEAQRRLNEARLVVADRRRLAAHRYIELERATGGNLNADAGGAVVTTAGGPS